MSASGQVVQKQSVYARPPCFALQVWSTKEQSSVVQLDMKANVCSVKYSPASAHQLAIGSADHYVHLYDLRKPSEPLHMFSGNHATSYVFLTY